MARAEAPGSRPPDQAAARLASPSVDPSRDVSAIRKEAWQTRRAVYGPGGHDPLAYGRGKRSPKPWPSFEYDEGYPEDETFSAFTPKRPKPNFRMAAKWLMDELPRAAEYMPCFCTISDGLTNLDAACKLIEFSTGGWSGAESIVALIRRRPDLRHFMLSWRRGGHFVFEVPQRFLSDTDRSGEADETAKQAQPEARARAEGIAQNTTGEHHV